MNRSVREFASAAPLTPLAILAIISMSLFVLGLSATSVYAAQVTVSFTATVITTTGDLSGPVATNDVLTGTITYESTTTGVFTPSPNPMFVRSEMFYSGAIVSTQFTLNGNPISGTGGDTQIFDATQMFAGEDSYEITSTLTSGSLGAATPVSFFFNPSFDFGTYTLMSGDPLPDPLPVAQSTFLQFNITSATGGTAYGSIDTYQVMTAAPPVPALGTWGLGLLVTLLIVGAVRGQDRIRSRSC